jgi:hypothetical protein
MIETPTDAGALSRISPLIYDHLKIHAPMIVAVPRSAALAGGLRAGAGTLAGVDASGGVFRKLAQRIVHIDLGQLRGAERTAAQTTQPLWLMRDALVAER